MDLLKELKGLGVPFVDRRHNIRKHVSRNYLLRQLHEIKRVAIHHSATATGSADSFANYHVSNLGWPSIGYTFVINRDGKLEWCLPLEEVSYNVGNHNRSALGVCLVGNFSAILSSGKKAEPTEAQLKTLYALVSLLLRFLKLKPDAVLGHREFSGASTLCPSIDMGKVRGTLGGLLTINVPTPSTHVIVRGDTLWGLSQKYKISVADLTRFNPTVDPTNLRVGQIINLGTLVVQSAPKKYTITSGDTLFRIAQKHGLTVQDIVNYNPGINADVIRPGQVINLAHSMPNLPTGVYRRGNRGKEVEAIQTWLNQLGFRAGTIDGIYGANTEESVRRAQRAGGVSVDGVYGAQTRSVLMKLL